MQCKACFHGHMTQTVNGSPFEVYGLLILIVISDNPRQECDKDGLKARSKFLYAEKSDCFHFFFLKNSKWQSPKQYPVLTMQKTGLANYSSILAWKRVHIAYGYDHYGAVDSHFLCITPFSAL